MIHWLLLLLCFKPSLSHRIPFASSGWSDATNTSVETPTTPLVAVDLSTSSLRNYSLQKSSQPRQDPDISGPRPSQLVSEHPPNVSATTTVAQTPTQPPHSHHRLPLSIKPKVHLPPPKSCWPRPIAAQVSSYVTENIPGLTFQARESLTSTQASVNPYALIPTFSNWVAGLLKAIFLGEQSMYLWMMLAIVYGRQAAGSETGTYGQPPVIKLKKYANLQAFGEPQGFKWDTAFGKWVDSTMPKVYGVMFLVLVLHLVVPLLYDRRINTILLALVAPIFIIGATTVLENNIKGSNIIHSLVKKPMKDISEAATNVGKAVDNMLAKLPDLGSEMQDVVGKVTSRQSSNTEKMLQPARELMLP